MSNRPYAEVIGDPICHSKSPLIHQFWIKQLGIDADYRAVAIKPAELRGYIAERKDDPQWRGCNVTLPHKVAVLDHVDDPGDVRNTIGAANTIARLPGGALFATNTDAAGFYQPLSGLDLATKSAVVVGTGGAARAVLFALARSGIGRVTMVARRPLAAAGLLSQFGLSGTVQSMSAALPSADLIINASPLGMSGYEDLLLDLTGQRSGCIVYDLVYSPLETALLAQADRLGLQSIGGLEMLIGQAQIAFELFFGASAPVDANDQLLALLTQ